MAEAIVGGILDAKIAAPKEIVIGEPFEQRRAELADKYGVDARPSNLDALDGAELVVLSIKPQSLPEVMAELGPSLNSQHTVVSIIAGARMDTLVGGLKHAAVIRVMPNTPAQIGAGMSVWTASDSVPEAAVSASRDILRTLGEELYVEDEKLIDMATALSASGPAYADRRGRLPRDAARYGAQAGPADRCRQHEAGARVGAAPRRPQGHGHVARRDDRRGAARLRAGRLQGGHPRSGGGRIREVQGAGRA